jgi:hypothetical protein
LGGEQGDTLATTMFNVFSDGVLQQGWEMHEGSPVPSDDGTATKLTALMYADDLTGLATSPERLQALANHTQAALATWQLRASVSPTDCSKTACMKVLGGSIAARTAAARRTTLTEVSITWGDTPIPQVNSYKYLGAWITNTNTWDLHLANRMKSATKVAHAHYKVMSQTQFPVHVRKLALTSVVQPHVTYAAQVWTQPKKELQQKLDSFQMSLATRMFHCHPKTSHMCLQQEVGLVPLHITCELFALRYWHHLQTTPVDRLLHKVHSAWTGKHHPWSKHMTTLLAKYQVNAEEAKVMTKACFKQYVGRLAMEYLKTYWQHPPRQQSPVHARYVDTFGVGEIGTTRPRIRKFLREMTADTHLPTCQAAELYMHMRLECLPLRAFHCHQRRNETTAAQNLRQLCPCCQQHPETPAHFLLECSAYSSPRSAARVAAAVAQVTNTQGSWRRLLADHPATMADYILAAWNIRRAALAGRGANGGNPMVSAPELEPDIAVATG